MLTFDHLDFTKSAWSLAGGMLGVALMAAWRSQGDIPTVSLTLGLPLGVLAFWGIYSLRMKRMAEDLGFVRDSPQLGSFQPKLLRRACPRQLTADARRPLPRFRTRSQGLPWDTPDHTSAPDQWHM